MTAKQIAMAREIKLLEKILSLEQTIENIRKELTRRNIEGADEIVDTAVVMTSTPSLGDLMNSSTEES